MTPPFRHPKLQAKARSEGFSLAEVVLALGICSFAMISIFGMIPIGLSTFKDAMDTTAQSQIVQSLASEVLLTDYSILTQSTAKSETTYYNDQGVPTTANDAVYSAVIEQERLETPAALVDLTPNLSDDPGLTVIIKITRINNPAERFSYPIIVANNSTL